MRVLIIHNEYQQLGGEAVAVQALCELLATHGHEVHCYSRHNDELQSLSLCGRIGFSLNTIYSLRTRRDIQRLVREVHPEVALVNNVFPLISPSVYDALFAEHVPFFQILYNWRFFCINGLFCRDGRICTLCHGRSGISGIRYRCYRNSLFLSALYAMAIGLCRRRFFRRAQGFICLTPFMREMLAAGGMPEQKIRILPLHVKTTCVAPPAVPDGAVVYVGRLSPEKGLWTLIRAFEQPGMPHLLVIGGGPLELALRDYVATRHIANIKFTGRLATEQVQEHMRSCAMGVVPSECCETFGLSILEFYLQGKPVVASDIGSLSQVIESGQSGLLFKAGVPGELAEQVRWLYARPDELARMGRRGRELVEQVYAPDRIHERLLSIMAEATESARE